MISPPFIDWYLAWQRCPFYPDAKPLTHHSPNAIEKPFGYGRVLAFSEANIYITSRCVAISRETSREIVAFLAVLCRVTREQIYSMVCLVLVF